MKQIQKKGASMALNIVIVAVILIVILSVLLVIFFRGTSNFERGTGCSELRRCVTSTDQCLTGETAVPMRCRTYGDVEGSFCCVGGNG